MSVSLIRSQLKKLDVRILKMPKNNKLHRVSYYAWKFPSSELFPAVFNSYHVPTNKLAAIEYIFGGDFVRQNPGDTHGQT